jgi:hypothetical protein
MDSYIRLPKLQLTAAATIKINPSIRHLLRHWILSKIALSCSRWQAVYSYLPGSAIDNGNELLDLYDMMKAKLILLDMSS